MATLGVRGSPALRPLPIGQSITIVAEENDIPQEYLSRIEDVLDSTVVVSMPMRHRNLVAPRKDSTVSAFFNLDGARYSFRAVVRGQMDTPLPVLFLADVRDVRRLERRSFARVGVILEPLRMAAEGDEEASKHAKRVFVVDLSAGGLGLISRRPLKVGGLVDILLDLPRGSGKLEARASVAWCTPLEREGVPKWKVGVSFCDMTSKDRDRITAFVLQYQQVLRRRGLI